MQNLYGQTTSAQKLTMNKNQIINVFLIDPSLFTGPYDAALTEGLLKNQISPKWVTRPLRPNEQQEIPDEHMDDFFYRIIEKLQFKSGKLRNLAKGLSHILGLLRLVVIVANKKPDIVHFQWIVLPFFDVIAIRMLRLICPVILTVHDTTPFNGEHISFLQNAGFDLPLHFCDNLIVHTQSALQTLVARGIPINKINVIPHGPLKLNIPLPELPDVQHDNRWTFVLFGEIKPYKGFDIIVEAFAQLPIEKRQNTRLIVAGRPRMDIAPILDRIDTLNLNSVIDVRPQRLTETEMSQLFAEADCFVFPYHQIDASGVYFLVKGLGKWLIASRVGIFAEDMKDKVEGALVASGDIAALADEILYAIENRPAPLFTNNVENSWKTIGQTTRALYEATIIKRNSL